MSLSNEQRMKLEAAARRRGIDPKKLIAAAERGGDDVESTKAGIESESTTKEKANLYMYLLPFVTVNEVRTVWLELEPIAGGEEYAAAFAAKQFPGRTTGMTTPDAGTTTPDDGA